MSNRTIVVSAAESGQTLAAVLRGHLGLSWSGVRRLVHGQRIWIDETACRDAGQRMKSGQLISIRPPASEQHSEPSRRDQATDPVIRHIDADVVVVEKPSGMTTMRHPKEAAEFGARARRFLPPTLADRLPQLLAEGHAGRFPMVRAVHRIDNETSGLVVFARTAEAERHLGKQFRQHTIDRHYLAVVRGRARAGRIESNLVRDRGDGRRGSGAQSDAGQRAVTHVDVQETLGDFTLVSCRLETGRTHQVRIHLAESGTPICGERVYDRPLHGQPVSDSSGSPRLALHAAGLGFVHPRTGKRMTWTSRLPDDLATLVARLRQLKGNQS
jgi:23S rRNA pseudouridine1911/1915/1917 synthase